MRYTKLVLFTLISLIVTDSIRWLSATSSAVSTGTYISIFLIYVSIAIFIFLASKERLGNDELPKTISNLIKIWLFWNILNMIRGGFLAMDYWDWKFLFYTSIPFSLIPFAIFIGQNLSWAKIIFRFTLKYIFPFGFLLIPLTMISSEELYSRIMIPIGLFILFLPFLKSRWRILIVLVAFVSIVMVLGFRSNIIKIAFSTALLLVYYFRNYIGQRLLRIVQFGLFFIPLVFLSLAITGQYNLFKDFSGDEGYYISNRNGDLEVNNRADTRTFLYVEVFSSLNNSGHWLIGEGSSGKYQSEYFDYLEDNRGRYGSEVGILNILLYHGIVGVVIYFLVLFAVSTIAIKRSNNVLAKMLGLFIAFRWTFAFVEEFTQFDLNFYFFWLAIGLVSSASFRSMSDNDIKNYIKLV